MKSILQPDLSLHIEGSRNPCVTANQIELRNALREDSGKGKADSKSSSSVGNPSAALDHSTRQGQGLGCLGVMSLQHLRKWAEGPPGTWGQLRCLGAAVEKEMATHSSILAWRIPRTEKPGTTVHGVAKSQTLLSNFAYLLTCI